MTKKGSGIQHMVHGMGESLVEPDWAPLGFDETRRLLKLYPQMKAVKSLLWHSPRPFSAASIVETRGGRLFVKRHHRSVRDTAGLIEEHQFIAHLRRCGVPISEILTNVDGVSATEQENWTYEVHRLARGFDLYRDAVSWSPFVSAAHASAAGRVLAQLHVASRGYEAPVRHAKVLVASFTIFASDSPISMLQHYVSERPALADFLSTRSWIGDVKRVLLPFHERLQPWLDGLQRLWTHNDWHASNLLWTEEGPQADIQTIIDFSSANYTCALYDLATAIERNVVEWLAIHAGQAAAVRYDLLDALLDGYETILPLSQTEWLGLRALLPLVHAEYALSEIDYFYGIVHAPENAELAYDSYFLGHANWFNNLDGRRLLLHLEQRIQRGWRAVCSVA